MICTQNAGEVSHYFCKTRGVNQGCPISPGYYNVIGAVMALLIKTNPHIEGVKMGKVQTPYVITQFADNTGLYLKYSKVCLDATIETLACIEKNTGLKVSYEKTCIYRVGSLKNSNAELYTQKNLSWSDFDIEMLGVTITNAPMQTTDQYEIITNKMQGVINTWGLRLLPLSGKILLVNTLMGSLYIHTMMVLPPLSKIQSEKMDKMINHFLWNGKKVKIPLKILRRAKSQGGLRLVDLNIRYLMLQARWAKKALQDETFSYTNDLFDPALGADIWHCNLDAPDVIKTFAPVAW